MVFDAYPWSHILGWFSLVGYLFVVWAGWVDGHRHVESVA